jgi:hypothetical protein
VAAFVLGGLVAACDLDSRTVTMRIDHYRDPCWASGPQFCLRVLDSSDPDVIPPRAIEGFEHDWGHVYELAVQVHAFGANVHYDLVEVTSREPVSGDAVFTLPLTGDFITRVDGRRFDLLGGMSAECGEATICETVAQALRSDAEFTVELGYPAEPGRPLVAHAVHMND